MAGRLWQGLPWAGLGALAGFGQAPWGLWWLTTVALAVVMVLPATGPRDAAARLWFLGFGYALNALRWVIDPFLIEPEVYGWMAPFALLFMASGFGVFWALAGALAAWLGRAGRWPLALALTLTLTEALRAVVLTGFPWALVGHVLIGTPLAGLSAWLGPNGLTLAVALLAASLAGGFRAWRPHLPVMAVAVMGALWLLLDPGPVPAPDGLRPVARLVQPNAAQADKWDPLMADAFRARMIGYTSATPRPDLVIWPETAIDVPLEWADPELAEAAAAADGVPLILGINRSAGGRYYNSMVLVGPRGLIVALYDKNHLVPFGEYLPLGDFLARFGLHGLAASEGNGFSAGLRRDLIDIPGVGGALPLICYEGIFAPEVNASAVRPDFLLLITNDAWFGVTAGPQQHLAQARLRAIEQGLPMVRVANTGISAVIDGKGRVVAELGIGVAGYLDVPLPPALGATPYARWGELPAMLLLAAGLIWLARSRRTNAD